MTTYVIDYSDPLKSEFSIQPGSFDGPGGSVSSTSLRLYGRGALEWGESVDENLVRLLENFAGATPPLNPTAGQMWFQQKLYWRNTTPGAGSNADLNSGSYAPLNAFFQYSIVGKTWTPNVVVPTTTSFSVKVTNLSVAAYPAGVQFTGSTSGTTLTVTAVAAGNLAPGQTVFGAGVLLSPTIVSQLTGVTGGIGTYTLSVLQAALGPEAMTTPAYVSGINPGEYVWSLADGALYRWDSAYKQAPVAWLPRAITTAASVPGVAVPEQSLKIQGIGGTFIAPPMNNLVLTGIPTAPTAAVNTNTTQISTTAFVINQFNASNAGPTGVNAIFYPMINSSSAAGSWPVNTSIGLTFNPSTNTLSLTALTASGQITSTVITGTAPFVVASTTPVLNLSIGGNAATATTATNATNTAITAVATNAAFYPTFVSTTAGNLPQQVSTGLTFNPSTNTLTATTFAGALTGNATTASTATNAQNTAIAAVSTNATFYPTFVSATVGNLPHDVAVGLTFNPSTNTLTATTFAGALTGNATTASTANATNTGNSFQMNSLGVGVSASGTAGEIRATNNITAYYSDERLKDIIGIIPDALTKVCSLRGVTYTSNNVAAGFGYTDQAEQVGVLAQDVQKVQPQVVTAAPFDIGQAEDGTEFSVSGENYLTVRYERLVPLLIEAIKELKLSHDALQTELNQLKGQ